MFVVTDAVADANRAIELNPKLSKAFLRKGYAAKQKHFIMEKCRAKTLGSLNY